MPEALTVALFQNETVAVEKTESKHGEPALPGVTEGTPAGTDLKHKKCCDRWAE